MCTVSFFPHSDATFILSSNRDESNIRPTSPPVKELIGEHQVVFPKDKMAGGTWIASSNLGVVCCLLNGAFEKHKRNLPYLRSRGTVLKEVFEHKDVLTFFEKTDLYKVEPFTLIVIDYQSKTKLYEFRWDEQNKHLKELPSDQPHIWSSSTLYPLEIRQQRELWFDQWLKKYPQMTDSLLLDFHRSKHGDNEEHDLVMKRGNILQTISMTQIITQKDQFMMKYHDLLEGKEYQVQEYLKRNKYV